MKNSRQSARNISPSVSPMKSPIMANKNEASYLPNFQDIFNQKMNTSPNEKGFLGVKQKNSTSILNASFQNKKDQMSLSSQSRSPQKPQTSYKNQSQLAFNQGISNKNANSSPLSNKGEIMNQTPKIFQSFFLETQRNEQKVVKDQYNKQQQNQQSQYNIVNKDGMLINCELAHKYDELAQFTKELQTTMKKGTVLSEEDLLFIAKKNSYENFVENPYSLILQSVSAAPTNQKDTSNRNNENMRY